jgi:hypothetical protein
VKSLSDSKRNQHLLSPEQQPIPSEMSKLYHEAEGSGECSKFDVPECLKFRGDLLLDDLKRRRKSEASDTLSESILKVIKKVDGDKSTAPTRGMLKRGSKSKSKSVDLDNIVSAKRMRKSNVKETDSTSMNNAKSAKMDSKPKKEVKVKKTLPTLKKSDRVKILTTRFGIGYAKGKPKWTWGKVVSVSKDNIVAVEWDSAEGRGEVMKAHLAHLVKVNPVMVMIEKVSKRLRWKGWPFKTVSTMLPILEVGSVLTDPDPNESENWPRDFIEALIRPDWRNWVEAVKSENESWETFDACCEIPYHDCSGCFGYSARRVVHY